MNLGLFSAVCLWLCNLFAELPPAKATCDNCADVFQRLRISDCERINLYQDVCMDACHMDLAQPSEHSLVRFELLSTCFFGWCLCSSCSCHWQRLPNAQKIHCTEQMEANRPEATVQRAKLQFEHMSHHFMALTYLFSNGSIVCFQYKRQLKHA